MESKYDSYGVLKDVQEINIQIGSVVEYTDTISTKSKTGGQSSKKVKLTGVWNGDHVAFNDKDKTVVRTTRWLTILEPITKKLKF